MIQERQKEKPKAEQVDSLTEAAKQAGVSRRTAATQVQKAKAPEKAKVKTTKPVPIDKKPLNAKLAVDMLEVMRKRMTVTPLDTWKLTEQRALYVRARDIANRLEKLPKVKQ